ncbi:SRPBCC family protein [Aeromicrobium panaciterrae]|uniref:SRPBCC family protein n=1 Tax=Aeromicrobium panaciterrae TaxID=363861 RepID=UPI0031D4C8DF
MTDTTYEVNISRYFDAPPELVYRAFTDPEQLSQWIGPLMFTVPLDTVSIDPSVGGHWRMTMVGKDNPEWRETVDATFTEVIENRLLVGYETTQGFPGLADGTRMTLSIELIPEGEGTRLELTQGPVPEEMQENATVGWTQALYKLDALLATPAHLRNSPPNQDSTTEGPAS